MNPAWNYREITETLLIAGDLAWKFYDRPGSRLKEDGSVVTEADQAIESCIRQRHERPGQAVLGEELVEERDDAGLGLLAAERLLIADPIDGTAFYAHQLPIWGISLGLAVGGRLVEGAIYLPVTGELLISSGPQVLLARVSRDTSGPDALPFEPVTMLRRPWTDNDIVAMTPELARHGGLDLSNPLHALSCAVVPLLNLAFGRYCAYLGNLKLWDLAGGWPLLHKLGFEAVLTSGRQLPLEVDDAYYTLDADDPHCWRLHALCLFSFPGQAQHVLNALPAEHKLERRAWSPS